MSNRIEREVEELLARIDKFPPKKPLRRRVTDRLFAPFRAIRLWLHDVSLPRVSAGHVLLASIVVVVIAWVALDGYTVQNYILGGGILLFVGAFAWSLRRQSRPPEKYWRDRPIDDRRRRR